MSNSKHARFPSMADYFIPHVNISVNYEVLTGPLEQAYSRIGGWGVPLGSVGPSARCSRVSGPNVLIEEDYYEYRPSPAFCHFILRRSASLVYSGCACTLIFKPFCTCSIMCDESQMNKASAVIFFSLSCCAALLKSLQKARLGFAVGRLAVVS